MYDRKQFSRVHLQYLLSRLYLVFDTYTMLSQMLAAS